MRKLISAFKLACVALTCAVTIPLQWILMLFSKGPASYYLPQLWHIITCRVFALKVDFVGQPVTDKQVFFVGNHLSHFDIFILGSQIRATFVAKDDLSKWPFISTLCRLQQTAFVSRDSKQAASARNSVQSAIDLGKSIILFPEGTSTRGDAVLDFKSPLFSLPLQNADRGLYIQPFTILLISVDGKPSDTKELKDLYAWDRDNPIDIGPHILNFSRIKGARLQVIFHPVLPVIQGEDRKILAKRVQEIVAAPLVQKSAAV